MRIASLETLFCDAGWRPWIFLKATTDDGLVGWAEITDSHGSPHGLAGIVEDLSPLVVGRDPRPVEAIYWDLYRATRQSPGSIIAKALAGIENALLDIKGKALGVPVYELFGGPTRASIPMYWSHCGTTRARAFEVTGTAKLASYDDVVALGREVVEHGYGAFKTNVVVPGDDPKVLMPGFNEGGGTLRADEIADALVRLLEAFREGTGDRARPIVDLNFNLEPEGCVRVAKALDPFDLLWLEVDLFDAGALAHVRHVAPMPICSGENLYGSRDFRPYLEAGGMDVASVDVIWNGFHQAKKIADLAETFEVNCAPHNYYSPPRDVHRGAVVRGDPERAHPRVRRRRRAVARCARHGASGDLGRRAPRSGRAGLGRGSERGRAARARLAARLVPVGLERAEPALERQREPPVAPAELHPRELRELVGGGVGNPAPLPRVPQPLDLAPRVAGSGPSQRTGAARVRGVRPLRRDARVEEAPERRSDRVACASGGLRRPARTRARSPRAARAVTTPGPRS